MEETNLFNNRERDCCCWRLNTFIRHVVNCSFKKDKTLLTTEDQKSNRNFALHQCQTLKRCSLLSLWSVNKVDAAPEKFSLISSSEDFWKGRPFSVLGGSEAEFAASSGVWDAAQELRQKLDGWIVGRRSPWLYSPVWSYYLSANLTERPLGSDNKDVGEEEETHRRAHTHTSNSHWPLWPFHNACFRIW